MQILVEISVYVREVELRKLTAYLKHKYRMKEMTINYTRECEYLLPFQKKLLPSLNFPSDINDSIASYNNEVDILT